MIDNAVRIVTDPVGLQELYRFRYRLEGGNRQSEHEWGDDEAGTVTDSLDASADNLVAYQGGEIVAAVRINLVPDAVSARSQMASPTPVYAPAHHLTTSVTSRLTVSPSVCRTMLPMRLCVAAYGHLLDRRVLVNFIEANESQAWFFRRQGYLAEPSAVVGRVAERQLMRLDILDEAHLKAVRSPLLKCLNAWQARSPQQAA